MDTKNIFKTVVVAAEPARVWQAFTTEEGARTFFAPSATIDLKTYGRYEMLFDLDAPEGSRGGEGCKVLAFQPDRMLTVTWNAPHHLPAVRDEKTCVILDFVPEPVAGTRVTRTHVGWGEGGEWDAAYAYFDRAWDLVLSRLVRSLAEGPLDWESE